MRKTLLLMRLADLLPGKAFMMGGQYHNALLQFQFFLYHANPFLRNYARFFYAKTLAFMAMVQEPNMAIKILIDASAHYNSVKSEMADEPIIFYAILEEMNCRYCLLSAYNVQLIKPGENINPFVSLDNDIDALIAQLISYGFINANDPVTREKSIKLKLHFLNAQLQPFLVLDNKSVSIVAAEGECVTTSSSTASASTSSVSAALEETPPQALTTSPLGDIKNAFVVLRDDYMSMLVEIEGNIKTKIREFSRNNARFIGSWQRNETWFGKVTELIEGEIIKVHSFVAYIKSNKYALYRFVNATMRAELNQNEEVCCNSFCEQLLAYLPSVDAKDLVFQVHACGKDYGIPYDDSGVSISEKIEAATTMIQDMCKDGKLFAEALQAVRILCKLNDDDISVLEGKEMQIGLHK